MMCVARFAPPHNGDRYCTHSTVRPYRMHTGFDEFPKRRGDCSNHAPPLRRAQTVRQTRPPSTATGRQCRIPRSYLGDADPMRFGSRYGKKDEIECRSHRVSTCTVCTGCWLFCPLDLPFDVASEDGCSLLGSHFTLCGSHVHGSLLAAQVLPLEL